MEIILASASPRRRELLEFLNVKCITADIDETFPDIPVHLGIQEIAAKKAAAVAKQIDYDALVIGADTIVYANGKIIGKPKDQEDAFKILSSLSGKKHEVMTGVAVIRTKDCKMDTFCSSTDVYFKDISDKQILDYIKTGEPMDKAGAYGIQGRGGELVEKTEGDLSNVVGMPVDELLKLLENEYDFKKEDMRE